MPASALDLMLRGGGGVSLGVGGGAEEDDGAPDVPGGGVPSTDIRIQATLGSSKNVTLSAYQNGVKVADPISGVRYDAGAFEYDWTAVDFDGNPLTGTVDFKFLTHNNDILVQRLGNSTIWVGEGQYQQYQTPKEMRLDGTDTSLLAIPGYSESPVYLNEAQLSSPEDWRRVAYGTGTGWYQVCGHSDGTYLYVVFRKAGSPYVCGLRKWHIANKTWGTFSSLTTDGLSFDAAGGGASANYSQTFLPFGANASATDVSYEPTRVAAMVTGDVIAVCIPGQSEVQIYDKATGEAYTSVEVAGYACAWNSSEGTLWIAGVSGSLAPYIKADWTAGGTPASTGDISHGYSGDVVDIRSDYGNNVIWCAFNTEMQVVPLDEDDGSAAGTALFTSGGYASTTDVVSNTCHFGSDWFPTKDHWIGNIDVYQDGTVLVYDAALERVVTVSDPLGTPSYSSTPLWQVVPFYGMAVDKNDNTRFITQRLLGYTRDWTTDPSEGTLDGFTLDKWWGYAYYNTHFSIGVSPGTLFSDTGQLFGVMNGRVEGTGADWHYLVEFTSSGVTEISSISHNGYLYQYEIEPTSNDKYRLSSATTLVKASYTGLSGGVPTWGAESTYVTLPGTQPVPNPSVSTRFLHRLAGGDVIILGTATPGTEGTPHLARYTSSGDEVWRHLWERDASMPFPDDGYGTTDGNNGPVAMVVDESETYVFVSWQGEFYNDGQAATHLMYTVDGQFVMRFGGPNLQYFSFGTAGTAFPGPINCGNSQATHAVVEEGYLRYLLNGENGQSAITEVRIDDSTLTITTASGTVGGVVNFGTIAGDSDAPDDVGADASEDLFGTDTIGSTYIDVDGEFEITGGVLRVNSAPAAYNGVYTLYDDAAGSHADDIIEIDIPNPYNGQGHGSVGSNILANWGVGGRYNPANGLCIGAYLQFYHNAGYTDPERANGILRGYLFCIDADGVIHPVLRRDARFLPDTRDSDYRLQVFFAGASPTRLGFRLIDTTQNLILWGKDADAQTTLSNSDYGSAGYNFLLGTKLSEITRYATKDGTWTKSKLPYPYG